MSEYDFRIDVIRNGVSVRGLQFQSDVANAMQIFWLISSAYPKYSITLFLDEEIFVTRNLTDREHHYSRREDRSISFTITK